MACASHGYSAADQTRDHKFSAAHVLEGAFLNNEVGRSNRDIYICNLEVKVIRDINLGPSCS